MALVFPRLRRAAAAAALALAAGAVPGDAQLRRLDLAGEWRYLPYNGEGGFGGAGVDDARWPTMRVPSSWFLLGGREYPGRADRGAPVAAPGDIWPVDPARGLDWSGTVWFRRTVEWRPVAGRTVLLELDMVDYYAEVFVNGTPAGRHEGYFQRWAVDVTRLLRPGRNQVAVRVSAPELPFDMSYRWPISWPKQQNQVKGIFLYHDTRPGATSARGQERGTGGILRGIALRESHGVEIEELRVLPTAVSHERARLVVEATVRNWTGRAAPVVVRGTVAARNFASPRRIPVELRLTAAPGISRARTEVRVEEPRLWWSWDYGAPNLYRLDATLSDAGGRVRGRSTAVFGIRSITRDSAWVWRLNGRRIYPRGTNYIATQWLSQADRAWYDRDVAMMVGAHLNTVRVHAHLERPEFYEAADSAGLMVWQDFPLQWGYTDSPGFQATALRQAEDMVRRFANHPSIAVWCMHNESPHAMAWMKKRDPLQNLALDEALVALARRLDPTRVHHRDSGTGDGHPYPGWYYGRIGDLWGARTEPFVTEYGAQALPNLQTLRSMFPGDTLFPRSPEGWETWRFRNHQPEQAAEFGGVRPGRTIEEFVAASQGYQSQVVRFATEVLRRRKWAAENPTTGIYHFMFVEDWPSVTWAVVDYYRRAKPGYAALRAAMQPVLPSIVYRIDQRDHPLSIVVVNDLHRAFPGAVVRWRAGASGGERRLDLPADAVVPVAELGSMPEVTRGAARLEVWIEDAAGAVLGRSMLEAADFRERH